MLKCNLGKDKRPDRVEVTKGCSYKSFPQENCKNIDTFDTVASTRSWGTRHRVCNRPVVGMVGTIVVGN